MSDLSSPELLDARIDRAAQALRADDAVAINRIVDSLAAPAPRRARRSTTGLRLSMGALTLAAAGVALYPWGAGGRAEANLAFSQVQEATRRAPHSIAQNYDADGRPTGYTVWREGRKYASELWTRDRKRLMSETRSDGVRRLHSFQWEEKAKSPGYRFAMLGLPAPKFDTELDTLEGILRTYMVKGPEPVAERVGDRLRYRIRPIWAKTEDMIVEADAESGRVLEIRSKGGKTVLDYATPVPAKKFVTQPLQRDILVVDFRADATRHGEGHRQRRWSVADR